MKSVRPTTATSEAPAGTPSVSPPAQKDLRGGALLSKILAATWAASCSLAIGLVSTQARGAEEPAVVTEGLVDYMILVTGGELLTGAFPDGHTFFITRSLHPLGMRCAGSLTVDDRPDDIKQALAFAEQRVPLVIVTGGLGPTDNDITRETLSDHTGVPLAEHSIVLQEMERRTRTARENLPANLRRQSRVPTRGGYLKNVGGSSVGLVFDLGDRAVVALPGPPGELQPMVRQELVPWLVRRFGTHLPGCTLTIRFVGLGQSQIDQTLDRHAPLDADIILQSQFEAGRVDFTFCLPDDTPQNRQRLEQLKSKILAHLGDSVYGVDGQTLEQHVLQRLADRGQTLALAEAGSGGALASALSGAEGAPRVLMGAVVAPDGRQLLRLVQPTANPPDPEASDAEATAQLATAAAEHLQADWCLAIGEVRHDPQGGLHVEVALHRPDGQVERQRVPLRGKDPASRAFLATKLLDILRKAI